MEPSSELRFDIVSKDWVVISPSRGKRPRAFKGCPFCNLSTQEKPVLTMENLVVIPNKYPAFTPAKDLNERIEGGIYEKMDAVGFQEIIVTKSHKKHLGNFSAEETEEVFNAYQKRYLSLMDKRHVNHISIFHNHGKKAGASIAHPHSQIITTPLIDIDLSKALSNAKNYFKKEKRCVYCKMNSWERREKKRIVFENKDFLAVCPFASKSSFQVIVSPKKHEPYFEKSSKLKSLAEIFSVVMGKLKKGLNNPDYNFYLHTAPCDNKKHDYYHYHWTILPKTSSLAGFEIGTRMEISTIEPEKAAEYLRKQ